MKKNLYILTCILFVCSLAFAIESSSVYKPKVPIRVLVAKPQDCDGGIGLCIIIWSKIMAPKGREVSAEINIIDNRMVFTFLKENLSSEVEDDLSQASVFPLANDFELPQDIITYFDLPDRSFLAEGHYAVTRDDDAYQVVIPVRE